MRRREFMIGAAAATGLAAVGSAWSQTRNEDKLSRIAIMMFGLNSIVKNNMAPSPERTLDIMDIGQVCADRYHVHNVELQSNYFPTTDISWLRDLKARLNRTKTRIVQINLELSGLNITADNASTKVSVIDLHRYWIDNVVSFLDCPRVLVNQGQPTEQNKDSAIAVLKAIVAIGKAKNVIVSSENRPGGMGGARPGGPGQRGGQTPPTSPPAPPAAPEASGPPSYILLTEILKAAGASACCDLVNFRMSQNEQQDGIRAMLPITSGLLHAGGQWDLAKAIAITKELGYKGLYSIKAMGVPGDPLENTQKIMDVVLANI